MHLKQKNDIVVKCNATHVGHENELRHINLTPTKKEDIVAISVMPHELYSGWCSVMGVSKNRSYCTWHVDIAWQQNLTKIKNADRKQEAYKLLRTLLNELDENKFYMLLEEVKNKLFVAQLVVYVFIDMFVHA